jgi:hypothetical protein
MGDSVNQSQNQDSPMVLLRRLHHWRMAFFGLMILVAGLITGAAATALVLHRAAPPERPGPPDRAYQMMLDRIMPRLHLTPQQAEQAGPVLRRHMQRLEEIREQGRVQIARELQSLHEEMSAVLSPQQQQLWRDLMRGLPGQFSRGPGRHGPGPKGPFGPRGGPQGRFRSPGGGSAVSPNDPAPQN